MNKPKYFIEIDGFENEYETFVIQAKGNSLSELIQDAQADRITRDGDNLGYWQSIEHFNEHRWIAAIACIVKQYKIKYTKLGRLFYL